MWSSSEKRVTSAAGRVFHDEGVWYEYFMLENDSSFVTQRFVYKPSGDEIGVEGFVSVEGKPERRLHVAKMTKID